MGNKLVAGAGEPAGLASYPARRSRHDLTSWLVAAIGFVSFYELPGQLLSLRGGGVATGLPMVLLLLNAAIVIAAIVCLRPGSSSKWRRGALVTLTACYLLGFVLTETGLGG